LEKLRPLLLRLAYELVGGKDWKKIAYACASVESLKQLREFVNELKEKFSDTVKEYKTMMFYKEHKFVFFPVQEKRLNPQ